MRGLKKMGRIKKEMNMEVREKHSHRLIPRDRHIPRCRQQTDRQTQ